MAAQLIWHSGAINFLETVCVQELWVSIYQNHLLVKLIKACLINTRLWLCFFFITLNWKYDWPISSISNFSHFQSRTSFEPVKWQYINNYQIQWQLKSHCVQFVFLVCVFKFHKCHLVKLKCEREIKYFLF